MQLSQALRKDKAIRREMIAMSLLSIVVVLGISVWMAIPWWIALPVLMFYLAAYPVLATILIIIVPHKPAESELLPYTGIHRDRPTRLYIEDRRTACQLIHITISARYGEAITSRQRVFDEVRPRTHNRIRETCIV